MDWDKCKSEVLGWPNIEEIPEGIRLNLGCGRRLLDGFINIDLQKMDGVDKVMDLFTFPWDLPDNYADYMIASHVVEHIPHDVRIKPETKTQKFSITPGANDIIEIPVVNYHPEGNKYLKYNDGFFCFFAEVHRVLKPGAFITVICPYGHTTQSLQDPTHTRFIVSETFGYLSQDQYDRELYYGIDFNFEVMHEGSLLYCNPWTNNLPARLLKYHTEHTINTANTVRVDMRVIK